MLITIVTAAWRVEGLKEVIKCIDSQTYKKWDHIIVNDNNPDVRQYVLKNKEAWIKQNRYVIDFGIRTHWWGGIARNVGAMISFTYMANRARQEGSEWICFFDDDNLWRPEHLETLVQGTQDVPEAIMIGVDAEISGYKNRDYSKIRKCVIAHQHCDLGNFMYNTVLFKKYGYFNPSRKNVYRYDYDFIKKILDNEGEERIHIIHKPTFIFYRKKK